MVTSEVPTFDDVRLTDYDVVLVRKNVKTLGVKTGNYQASFDVPVNEQVSLTIKRGYVIADLRFKGRKYRFVNTHLEDPSTNPALEYVQLAQAQELVKKIGKCANPVILVGDFNSRAPTGMTYQYLLSEKFVDVWNINQLTDDPLGYTYGHDGLLRERDFDFYERIDYVFIKKRFRPFILNKVNAWVIGTDVNAFDMYGLWASDHGGVVASFVMPNWKKHFAWGKD
jgi:endonuclease/exonuclease/phosphatase family metal-dependent hydrolase